ncbi:N-acyl amino acid synthase FeeM domain-containing protein [Sphingomonas crocodyli]|uniref:N-acyl amino acid synthase FeeM domain-containing protein n=1 Tax=Sphingomonas crocodyli TaxID=1979270 RepID=UPI0019CF5FE1|nr:acetyltransferase [Sphingomonas crocodyli]
MAASGLKGACPMSLFWTNDHFATDQYADETAVFESYPDQELQLPASSGELKTITVRLADSDDQRNSARMLVNRRYAWRGYGDQHQIPAKSSHMTFTASSDEGVVGTITLGVDSPAGLAADDIFKDEIDSFRNVPGAKVCELTKLAFDADVSSKPMLAALFHIVFIYGYNEHRCTDLFIEVNPRHRRFYQAMLGFKPVGEVKTNQSVDAPSVLMWLKVDDIRKAIDAHAGHGQESSRSLYPFFFSEKEEQGIFARLAASTRDTIQAKSAYFAAKANDPASIPDTRS